MHPTKNDLAEATPSKRVVQLGGVAEDTARSDKWLWFVGSHLQAGR